MYLFASYLSAKDFIVLIQDKLGRDVVILALKYSTLTFIYASLAVFFALSLISSFITFLLLFHRFIFFYVFFFLSSLYIYPFFALVLIVLFYLKSPWALLATLTLISFARLIKVMGEFVIEIAHDKSIYFLYSISQSFVKVNVFIFHKLISTQANLLTLEIIEIMNILTFIGLLGLGISSDTVSIGFILYQYLSWWDIKYLLVALTVYTLYLLFFIYWTRDKA